MLNRFILLLCLMPMISTCFAVNPEDMEPNKWYETIRITWPIRSVTCYPDIPGRMIGFMDASLARSDDYGKTWISIPNSLNGFMQSTDIVVSRIDGRPRVYAYVKRNDTQHSMQISFSDDGGVSWSAPLSWKGTTVLSVSPHGCVFLRVDRSSSGLEVLLRSTDEGVTWNTVQVFDYFTNSEMVTNIDFSPYNPSLVILGSSDMNYALMKSTDSGQTWEKLVNRYNWGGGSRGIEKVVFHPQNPQTLITIANFYTNANSLRISNDGGVTWDHFGQYGSRFQACDLIIEPENPEMMIVSAQGNNALYRTTDAGMTWTTRLWNYEYEVDFYLERSAWTPGEVFVSGKSILRSQDYGVTWKPVTANRDYSFGFVSRSHPGLMLFFSKEYGHFRSTDSGETWESEYCINSEEMLRPEYMLETPGNPTLYLFASDNLHGSVGRLEWEGRILTSRDNGATWQNLPIDQEHRLRIGVPSSINPKRFFGIFDNRPASQQETLNWLYMTDDEGTTWRKLEIPQLERIKDVADSPRDPNVLFVLGCLNSDRQALLCKSTDAGISWTEIAASHGLQTELYSRERQDDLVIDTNNSNLMYIASKSTADLYRSTDEGRQWIWLDKFASFTDAFCVSPWASNEMYNVPPPTIEGYIDKKKRSIDSGVTWSDPVFPKYICFSPIYQDLIYSGSDLRVMRIESTPPSICLTGYGTSQLQAGIASPLEIIVYAYDPDENDYPDRIDLFLDGVPLNASIQDDLLPGSGLFYERAVVQPCAISQFLVGFRAMDRFGCSSDLSACTLTVKP